MKSTGSMRPHISDYPKNVYRKSLQTLSSHLHISTTCINNWIAKTQFQTRRCATACWIRAHTVDFWFAEKSVLIEEFIITNMRLLWITYLSEERNFLKVEIWNKVTKRVVRRRDLIQKIIGNACFLCDVYLLLYSLQDCVPPVLPEKYELIFKLRLLD